VRAFRGCRLGEPSSGSELGAAAALRTRDGFVGGIGDGTVDESLLAVFLCRFGEATPEPWAESGVSASVLVREEVAGETGNRTVMAVGARCPEEATNGIGANSSVGAVDGVVK